MALIRKASEKNPLKIEGSKMADEGKIPKRKLLSPRDFLGEETYKSYIQDLESMNQFRNEVSKRRPTEAEIIIMKINKVWISFYKNVLNPYTEA